MKNRVALSLIGTALLLSLLAMPLLFRFFPFPSIEDTRHLKGEIRVHYHRAVGRAGAGQLAKIFVVTERESVEIDCGFPLDRRPCPYYNQIDGTIGEVWYHRIFGVVQLKLVNRKTGQQFDVGIDASRRYYNTEASNEKQVNILVISIVMLVIGILSYRRK